MQDRDGHVPAHAGVGDALAGGEAVAVAEILATVHEKTLEHDADDAGFSGRDLLGNGTGHSGLATEVLGAVAVAGVDHHARWQATGLQGRQGPLNAFGVVIRTAAAAA